MMVEVTRRNSARMLRKLEFKWRTIGGDRNKRTELTAAAHPAEALLTVLIHVGDGNDVHRSTTTVFTDTFITSRHYQYMSYARLLPTYYRFSKMLPRIHKIVSHESLHPRISCTIIILVFV